MSTSESNITTDHKEIREWAEKRGGKPARVKSTGSDNDPGLLRIDFPDGAEEELEQINWEEFFQKFEEKNLALLYQNETASGELSRFSKFVNRESD